MAIDDKPGAAVGVVGHVLRGHLADKSFPKSRSAQGLLLSWALEELKQHGGAAQYELLGRITHAAFAEAQLAASAAKLEATP